MKTNQLMQVAFSQGVLPIEHKTRMGSLSQLFIMGNRVRMEHKRPAANISVFLKNKSTQDFIAVIAKEQGIKPEDVVRKPSPRRNSEIFANIHLLIYAAMHMSPELHYEIIDLFINNKILEYRDESGDAFKVLNQVIDSKLPDRIGKDNKGIYIQCAKLLKDKVQPDGDSWNLASADQLRERVALEDKLVTFLENDLVKDWEHLKTLIDNL